MNAKLAHDLRSPLARAKTLALLLEEALEDERAEYLTLLQEALRDLEKLIQTLDNPA